MFLPYNNNRIYICVLKKIYLFCYNFTFISNTHGKLVNQNHRHLYIKLKIFLSNFIQRFQTNEYLRIPRGNSDNFFLTKTMKCNSFWNQRNECCKNSGIHSPTNFRTNVCLPVELKSFFQYFEIYLVGKIVPNFGESKQSISIMKL
jgi:hypothetical protein